jgi:predicted TIM-barrel fold metal-dependent hydrolase
MENLPDLTLVVDHMADCPVNQPQELEKLAALKRFPNVFVKISHTWSLSRQPYPWLDSQELVKRLYDAYRPAALDVGHRLAHHRGRRKIRTGSHRGPRRHEVSQRRR